MAVAPNRLDPDDEDDLDEDEPPLKQDGWDGEPDDWDDDDPRIDAPEHYYDHHEPND